MHEIYDPASGSERLCGPSKLLVPGRIIYPIPRSSSGPLESNQFGDTHRNPHLVWFGGYRGCMGLIWTLSNPLFFSSTARVLFGGALARGGTDPGTQISQLRGCLDQLLPRDTCFGGCFFFERLGPFTELYNTTTPELRITEAELTITCPTQAPASFRSMGHLVPTRLCILFHHKGCIGRHRR